MAETSQSSPLEASGCWERLFDVQNKWELWRYTVDPGDPADSNKLFPQFGLPSFHQSFGRQFNQPFYPRPVIFTFLLPIAKILGTSLPHCIL